MWRSLVMSLMLVLGTAVGGADAAAPGPQSEVRPLGSDVFVASGTVTVSQPVNGDLIVSGGNVDVDATVAGDALAFGGKVRLGAGVGGSVYAAAGHVSINAGVERNVRAVGGQIELGPKSTVGGNLSLAGGQLRLQGSVQGEVRSAGGRLLIDGQVGGDVLAYNGLIELGPNARIAGKLRYRSDEDVKQDAAAVVGGGIERLGPLVAKGERKGKHTEDDARHVASGLGAAGAVWTLGLIVLAGVMLAALPASTGALAGRLRQRPGISLLLGFIWLVCLPVAAVLLVITLVGIPLALVALALYAALMPIAYVVTGVGLADGALLRWLPDRAARLPARIVATALVLSALTLLGAVPVLGAAVGFLALTAGLGALLLQAWQLRPGHAG